MLNDHHDDSIKSDIYRRVEVITGLERRRRWTAEEKGRIVAESFSGLASVADVARRHHVSAGILYAWRKQARDGTIVLTAPPCDGFVPLTIDDGQPASVLAEAMIEVAVGNLVVRIPATADEATLRRVIRAVRSP